MARPNLPLFEPFGAAAIPAHVPRRPLFLLTTPAARCQGRHPGPRLRAVAILVVVGGLTLAVLPSGLSGAEQANPYTQPRWAAKVLALQAASSVDGASLASILVGKNVDVSNEPARRARSSSPSTRGTPTSSPARRTRSSAIRNLRISRPTAAPVGSAPISRWSTRRERRGPSPPTPACALTRAAQSSSRNCSSCSQRTPPARGTSPATR